jgi:hypothetical protein
LRPPLLRGYRSPSSNVLGARAVTALDQLGFVAETGARGGLSPREVWDAFVRTHRADLGVLFGLRDASDLAVVDERDRGVLLFHVSNRYYDLRPVLATMARDVGVVAGMRDLRNPPDPVAADPSQYVVMLAREEDFTPFAERGFRRVTATDPPPAVLWTDDHANTLAALRLDW